MTTNKNGPLTDYLLGRLSDNEIQEVEDRIFADEAFFDEVETAEDEVIESYLNGELTREQKAGFEQNFLASNRRRKRVEIAMALRKRFGVEVASSRAVASIPRRSARFWDAIRLAFSPRPLLAGAAALIAALVGWLAYRTPIPKPAITSARVSPPQAKAVNPDAPVPALPPVTEPPRAASIPAFVLLPSLTRGSAGREFSVPAGVAEIQLRLRSSIDITPGEYSVSLKTEEDRELWRKDMHYSRASEVRVNVPARLLLPGRYSLTLSAVSEAGIREELQDFGFEVKRR